ncbi:MAG: ABC transporter substrate-binding protein [Acetobacteraceae bacterium]
MPYQHPPPVWPRRAVLGAAAGLGTAATALPTVRLGVLVFGTVRWVARVIRRHRLDRAHGFVLRIRTLAGNDAAKVALLGKAVDLIVSDWLFVAAERTRGFDIRFTPFSSATGALVLGRDSPIRTLGALAGHRLGVAGGPYDKSWAIVRAVAERQDGTDLARVADVAYAAPPLLGAKLRQGALDGVLTYWNFAAALEVDGFRPLVTVAACAGRLGLPASLPVLGYVFDGAWEARRPHLLSEFLAAATAAEAILARSDTEWNAIRPLMNAPGERLFDRLRHDFLAGIPHPVPAATQEQAAARLFALLRTLGGSAATGGLGRLPAGVFWSAGS